MASAPILFIISFVLLVSIDLRAQAEYSNTITTGSLLSPSAGNHLWCSPSGFFAFGFYPQGDGFAIGVILVTRPENVVVWTANRDDPPVSSDAKLELTKAGLLLVTMRGEKKIISINTDEISSQASSAAMLDGGNFILLNESSHVVWQSFDYPTDTILGGQNLTSTSDYPDRLVSSKSRSDHSSGRFLLIMQGDGNLVSYPSNITTMAETAYWSLGTFGNDAWLGLNQTGYLFVQNRSGMRKQIALSNGSYPGKNEVILYRVPMDDDGIFRLYSHHMVSNTSSIVWESLQNQCEVKGFCGLNSYCQEVIISSSNISDCFCYPGFSFINPSIKFFGCYQTFIDEDTCKYNEDDPNKKSRINITPLENTLWYDSPYKVVNKEEEACKMLCKEDCNCWAVMYENSSCQIYNVPIRYGIRSYHISKTSFFKVVSKNIGNKNNASHSILDDNLIVERNKKTILVLALSLGFIACLCFVFALLSFIFYKHRYHRYKKLLENSNLGLAEDFSLQSFSYKELERATDDFKEEIGRGTFGAVYKGVLAERNRTIAVKRLEKVVEEGVREFRAEITTIGRTHHRNLVQLLGVCIEGSTKLLVYEFMSNGSLADHLFKAVSPPTWRERVRFVFDVARGIFYLHEECGVHIIHCNLTPQNILLDDTWTAKISDFGLARLLMPNQMKTSAGVHERSTSIGYFAPEWQKNAPISVKADIYSFGVVLLEIICCRRNIQLNVSTQEEIILSNWVYTCFKNGDLDKLVEDDEIDFFTLERMIKVGLWCIQDNPSLRPSMKNVILMLEGTMGIPVPPSPELLVLP